MTSGEATTLIDDWFVEHDGQRLVLDQEKVQAAIEAKQAIEDELRAELAIAECLATEMSDRATQLDALQERVKELEAENAAMARDVLADEMKGRREAERALAESTPLRDMLLLCGELGGIGDDETLVAYLRRIIDGLIEGQRALAEAVALINRMTDPAGEDQYSGCYAAARQFVKAQEGK